MFEQSLLGPPPLTPLTSTVKIMLTVWFIVLVPWVPFLSVMGSGMAFEGGDTLAAYLFVVMAWAYPVLVCVAYYFRRRRPVLVWLPALILVWVLVLPLLGA